jgi:hypothetical protein
VGLGRAGGALLGGWTDRRMGLGADTVHWSGSEHGQLS